MTQQQQSTDKIREIESALLCGYGSVTIDGIKVPLSRWELNAVATRKQKEKQANKNAKEIFHELNKPI